MGLLKVEIRPTKATVGGDKIQRHTADSVTLTRSCSSVLKMSPSLVWQIYFWFKINEQHSCDTLTKLYFNMQVSERPLLVVVIVFMHKKIYRQRHSTEVLRRKERERYEPRNTTIDVLKVHTLQSALTATMGLSDETVLSAHWWSRWGEAWPARCSSLRMMSPASLPSSWLTGSSPSSSMRQDGSVVQLSMTWETRLLSLFVSHGTNQDC